MLMIKRTAALTAALVAAVMTAPGTAHADQLPSRATVIAQMQAVDNYWLDHSGVGLADWQRSTYYLGALAYYGVSHDTRPLSRAEQWASARHFALEGGSTTRNPDGQAAGQVYLDLYVILHGKDKTSAIATSLHAMATSTSRSDWTWIDGVFMGMPAFVHYGQLTHNNTYVRTAYQLYHYPKDVLQLLSPERLYFRDRTAKSAGQLWDRGNGWAIAAQAQVLHYISRANPLAAESIRDLRNMASSLRACQRADGFWPVDLKNPQSDPETSGTALDTYAIAYGIRTGILDRETYLPVVERAWTALNSAVSKGRLGDVQGVARAPGPVDPDNTEDYAVGAYLLAGSEIAQL